MSKLKKPQQTNTASSRSSGIALVVILLIALLCRLYNINTPLADWHSWRQVDTASVARTFTTDGFDLLHPRYHDLSNAQTGQYNPKGYRFVEFPLYNALFAMKYKLLPVFPLEVYGRLVSVAFSLIIISIVFYLLKREENLSAAVFGSMIYAIFPFFVYYSRVVLPETMSVALVFMSILFLYLWRDSKAGLRRNALFMTSLIMAALALLVKPTAGFYFITLAYIFFTAFSFSMIKKWHPYVFFALSMLPFVLWRIWIGQFPEGIPVSTWLLTSVNTFEGQRNIFFKPAFFRWIFHERILLLIFGGFAAIFPVVGVLKRVRNGYLIHSIGVSALAYLLIFQGGNVQHDYYQTIILPALAMFGGVGGAFLMSKNENFIHRAVAMFIIVFILGFSWINSFYTVKGFYNYSHELVNVGNLINTLTPPDAKIVTDRNGDTTLLYLANRSGMPIVSADLNDLKNNHDMDYFVTDKSDIAARIQEETDFELIFENERVFIFRL